MFNSSENGDDEGYDFLTAPAAEEAESSGPSSSDFEAPTDHPPMYGMVEMTIVKANDLPIGDILTRSSDPYVVSMLKSYFGRGSEPGRVIRRRNAPRQVHTTETIKRTLNPTWNDRFQMIVDDAREQFLFMIVFDADLLKSDDLLGFVTTPLMYLCRGVRYTWELPVLGTRGTVTIQIKALDFGYDQMFADWCEAKQREMQQEVERIVVDKAVKYKQNKQKYRKSAHRVYEERARE